MKCSSFSDSFYCPDGIDPLDVMPSERSTSVLQAIISLPRETQIAIAIDVLDADPATAGDYADGDTFPFDVLAKVRETNCCDGPETPVEVYIDEEGYYSVLVYE